MRLLNSLRNSIKNIFKIKQNTKKLLIILVCFALLLGIQIYRNTFYVTVRFKELGPVSKHMAAYYNGFKIGKIVKIEPDKDFKHILVKVNLNIRNLKLPQNTTVHVKNFPSGELYLQFIYPTAPALKNITRGEILEGISPYRLEEFMIGQNMSGVTDIVSVHVIKALEAMEVANMEMKMFFTTSSMLMNENKNEVKASIQNVVKMTQSLAQAAENLNQSTKKINDAIDTQTIKGSTTGIKDSAENIKTITGNIKEATKDIDKTIKKIDSTMTHANRTAKNLECMSEGLNEALSKRFGGIRVMFGKPVNKKP